ncbi:MAG TPA: hypothetical protein VFH31_09230, partial [Pyrinomonadaceae bacterium]|nr:hypothetical protein [Pyrinomonadaceae bacterium]
MKCSTSPPLLVFMLFGFIATCTVVATAQTGVSSPTPNPGQTSSSAPSPSPSASPTPTTAPSPRVTRIVDGHLELDDLIRVQVDNLAEWAEQNDASKL